MIAPEITNFLSQRDEDSYHDLHQKRFRLTVWENLQARRSNFESEGGEGGLNYLVSKVALSWLGPTGVESFSKLGPLEWLKLTPNSEIFHSNAFIKQELVKIKKRICNVIKL